MLHRLNRTVVLGLSRGVTFLIGSRGTARWRRQIISMFVLLCSVAVVATAALAGYRRVPQATFPQAARALQVGIVQGQSVSAYVSTTRGELEAMPDTGNGTPAETYALISLRTYLAPDRLLPLLKGVTVVEVYLRVQLSQVQTEIARVPVRHLPDDLLTGMRQVAEANMAQAQEYEALAATLDGHGAAQDTLRQIYLSSAEAAEAEAAAYLSECSCVYAVVVRATPAALSKIAARMEVRAVDPAPEVLRPEHALFVAPLPEQRDIAAPVAPPSGG